MKSKSRLYRLFAYQFIGVLLVVMLCTLISAIGSWRGMHRRITDWVLQSNSRLLDQYASHVGASLLGGADEIYMQLLGEIANNKTYAFHKTRLESQSLLNSLNVQRTLANIQNANPLLSTVGIYYPQNNLLIQNGRIRYTQFYNDSGAELDTYAQRMRMAGEQGDADYHVEATPGSIYLVRTIQSGVQVHAAVFMEFSARALQDSIVSSIPFQDARLLVQDPTGLVLFDSFGLLAGKNLSDAPHLAGLRGDSGHFTVHTDAGEEMVSHITDASSGWHYIVSMPLSLMEDPGEYIFQSLMVSALSTLALGALCAMGLTLWQARPMRPIVELCDETGLYESGDASAYSVIHGTLTQLHTMVRDNSSALARLMPILRDDFIRWLLSEQPRDPGEIEDKMLLSQVSFPHRNFSVIAARPVIDESQADWAQAGIRLALSEALDASESLCGFGRGEDMVLALVNHACTQEALRAAMGEALNGARAEFRCHVSACPLPGALHTLPDGVICVKEAVRRGFLYPEQFFFDPEDPHCGDQETSAPFHVSLAVYSSALRAGNEMQAREALRGIIRQARERGVSLHRAQRLMLKLSAELENVSGGRPELAGALTRLTANAPDILSFEAELARLIGEELSLSNARPARQSAELASLAAAQISQGLLDSQLSLTSVAASLGISPNYLSRVFHEARGMTFIEYVAEAKLAYACGLLENTEMPLREISEAINYASPQYFISRFKKSFGVTPSVYREQRRAEKEES